MVQIVRYLLVAAICLILGRATAFGQTDWDAVLDRYEHISEQCLELRAKVVSGAAVADRSLAGLLQELSQLKSTLQGASGKMSPAQRKRFARIRDEYARTVGGYAPQQKSKPETGKPKTETIQPDPVTRVPRQNTFIPNRRLALNEVQHLALRCSAPSLSPKAISLPERRQPEPEIHRVPLQYQAYTRQPQGLHGFVLASVSVPKAYTYGGMAGLAGRRLGMVVSGRSNFQSVSASYRCTSDGAIEGGGRFWGDGSTACTAWMVNAGPVFRFGEHLSVFATGGIGAEKHYWHDITGSWAEVSDLSFRGLTLEAGAIASWRHIALSAGISWLHPARQVAATFGLGFAF